MFPFLLNWLEVDFGGLETDFKILAGPSFELEPQEKEWHAHTLH